MIKVRSTGQVYVFVDREIIYEAMIGERWVKI